MLHGISGGQLHLYMPVRDWQQWRDARCDVYYHIKPYPFIIITVIFTMIFTLLALVRSGKIKPFWFIQ